MIARAVSIDQVAATLRRIPALQGRALDRAMIEPLASLTNRGFKVTIDEEAFALRIAGAGTEHYIDRFAERHNARLAAALGIAPEVVHCDPAAGVMLTRFLAGGRTLGSAEFRSEDRLRQAAALLRRLHGSGSAFLGHMELFPKLDQYLSLIGRRGWPCGLDLREPRARAEAVRRALERQAMPAVPSHVDPVPDNFVISQGRLYLTDWEYSAMAEPGWDLAGLSIEAALDAREESLLLESYGPGEAPRLAARHLPWKASLLLLAAAWAVLQLVDGNPNGDFRSFARERLARHLELLDSAAFGQCLRELMA